MSNRIDFFQSEQTKLSLPAASVSILVDGMLCPTLELIEIARSGWPSFSRARLTYNPAAYTNGIITPPEDIESEFQMGKAVCIRQYYNALPPGAAAFSFPIFHGCIERIETRTSAKGETVEIIARDFSANLRRICVHGQRLAKADGSSMFLPGFDTIFNPDGKGNAAPTRVQAGGRSYTVFCSDSSQARLWNCEEVIHYLLCEYAPAGQLQTPTLTQLKATADSLIVRDLDVTGLHLLEALYRCCERIGVKFKFVPRLASSGPDQAIVFHKNGTGRTIELSCQPVGQRLSISRTNIAAMQSRRDFWPITHKYIGQGDFKVFEATFELVKAWDPSLEDSDYDKFSPSTNPDFHQVRDVYRKWCLNEAGQYTSAPYNRGDAFDFSKIFRSANFVPRRRRYYPALTSDTLGHSLGYYLQVIYGNEDTGHSWLQYLHAFNILLDECGVWLSSDRLDADTWFAAQQGLLKFRITASVIADERLTAVLADGPINSTAPVIEHMTTLPRQFKYRKVSGQSIFAGSSDPTLGIPNEADDSDALYAFVRRRAAASPETIETFDIQTPGLMFDYQVGDIVSTSPESRDMLACRSDNRSKSQIMRVQMNFRQQCTNLRIVRHRSCPL